MKRSRRGGLGYARVGTSGFLASAFFGDGQAPPCGLYMRGAMATIRRPVRSRPIRVFLVSMFAVPLVSLVALWAFAAAITVRGAVSNQNYNTTTRTIDASIQPLSIGLPEERAEAYTWLITGRTITNTSVLSSRAAVNQGLPAAQAALAAQLGQLSGAPKAALTTL